MGNIVRINMNKTMEIILGGVLSYLIFAFILLYSIVSNSYNHDIIKN